MLGRSNCCAPQKTCYSSTYDDYEGHDQKGNGRGGFNTCRPSFKENLCNRIKRVQESSKILENVLDISSTLVRIMCVCGIHECKANKALDVIIYAFMHFDEVAEHPGGKCKKRIRKEEFYNDLMRDCGMTKSEAKLTYSIVKCAFKAFYHKQVVNKYDAGFVDECEWKNAANRTINAFAASGATKSEVELSGRRILCAYENYICRLQSKMQAKANRQNEDKCTCNRGKTNHFGNGDFGGSFQSCQPPCPPPCSPLCPPPCPPPCSPLCPPPCQICPPPEPPLCGQLCCQLVCQPGSKYPQLVCKDACGRTFLKVDGNRVNFDPYVMECEAKRAAMNICPPCGADLTSGYPNKTDSYENDLYKERDTGSSDEKLAEICKAYGDDICDGSDEIYDEDVNRGHDDYYTSGQGHGQDQHNYRNTNQSKDIGGHGKDIGGQGYDYGKDHGSGGDRDRGHTSAKESRYGNRPQNRPDTRPHQRGHSPPRWKENEHKGSPSRAAMSISVKFTEEPEGHKMSVDMQGYCPNNGHAPEDIVALRVITNRNPPLDFMCRPDHHRSMNPQYMDREDPRTIRPSKAEINLTTPKASEPFLTKEIIEDAPAAVSSNDSKNGEPGQEEAGNEEPDIVVNEVVVE